MSRPRVFISYKRRSEGTAGDSEPLADALQLRLGAYEVFLDKQIPVGVEWHRCIDCGLDLAHAAVVLLSPAALASPWVQYELALLTFRARRPERPQFVLIIALLDGVDPKALQERPFDAMAVGALQLFVPKAATGTVAGRNEYTSAVDLCDRIVTALTERLPADKERKAHWVVEDVIDILGKFRRAAQQLEAYLGLTDPVPEDARLRRLAEALLRLNLKEFYSVSDFLNVDRAGRASAAELLELVFPFWVNAQSAVHLARLSEERKIPVVNAKEAWTLRQYIRRAEVHGGLWHVLDTRLPAGERADAVIRQFVGAAEAVRFKGADEPPLDDDVAAIERLDEAQGQLILFPLVNDSGAAEALLDCKKPWIRPIVVAETDPTSRSEPVVPALERSREEEAYRTYRRVCKGK